MQSDKNTVFVLWCRLTGTALTDFSDEERREFLQRPQIPDLAAMPYEVLLEAGVDAARRGALPLEEWLDAAQTLRPVSAAKR